MIHFVENSNQFKIEWLLSNLLMMPLKNMVEGAIQLFPICQTVCETVTLCQHKSPHINDRSKEAEDFRRIDKSKNRSKKLIFRLINKKFWKKVLANIKQLEKISLRKKQLLRNFINESLLRKRELFADNWRQLRKISERRLIL